MSKQTTFVISPIEEAVAAPKVNFFMEAEDLVNHILSISDELLFDRSQLIDLIEREILGGYAIGFLTGTRYMKENKHE